MKRAISAGLLCLASTLIGGGFAVGGEPAQECSILSKIPYVSRLFRNSNAATCERIGVDFSFPLTAEAGACHIFECASPCQVLAASCTESCDNESACCVERTTRKMSESLLLVEREEFHERELELLGELFEARLEASVLQAELELREEAAEREAKLQKELVAAKLKNAQLQAHLELAGEKEKLAADLHEAKLELATLKAKPGPAVAKVARRPAADEARKSSKQR